MSGGLNLWLESALNWKITQLSTSICKAFPFFTYTMFDYSVAIIVIMTCDKFYAILFPLRVKKFKFSISTKEYISAVSALFICCIINCHFLVSLTLVKVNSTHSVNNSSASLCTNNIWNDFYDNYWIYIDATVYSFLPFVLITIFNVSIIICLLKEKTLNLEVNKSEVVILKNQKLRGTLLNNVCNENENERIKTKKRRRSCTQNNTRLTLTLFFINISFCVLTMPIVILQIVIYVQINNNMSSMMLNDDRLDCSQKKENINDLLKAIFELLQFLNHSLNFFLYCLSGSAFREETIMVFSNLFKMCFFF